MIEYKEKHDANFWVYKIWKPRNVTHARIHVPQCSFCNYGKGTDKEKRPQGDGYDWIPFDSYDEAVKALEDFREEHNCDKVGNCGTCVKRGDLPPP